MIGISKTNKIKVCTLPQKKKFAELGGGVPTLPKKKKKIAEPCGGVPTSYIYSYIHFITLLLHTQYWIFNKSKSIEELLCYFMARFVSYSYLMLLMFLVMTEEFHGGNSRWFSFLEPNFCYMHKNFRKRVKLNSFFYRWILESYVFIYCPFVCFSGRWQYIIEIFFPKDPNLLMCLQKSNYLRYRKKSSTFKRKSTNSIGC